MGIGKRILSVLIGILFIISVSVLGGSLLAKQVLVKAISQAGIDTAISHRMMDAVFGYAGADDTQWIAKIQNKIEKNEEVQKITEKVMDEMVNDLSKGTGYKDVDISKELNQLLEDSMKEIKDSNPELTEDMLKLMKQQLKDEMDDVQDVLNSYSSNLYGNMKDTSTIQGKDIDFEFTSGTEFPLKLNHYKMIIHCGGCMLNEREMKYRLKCAGDASVPITNYGTAIAYMKGILERSIEIFPQLRK